MRETAAADFAVLARAGHVERQLSADAARRWRNAMSGKVHGAGWRCLSGYSAGMAYVVLTSEPLRPWDTPWTPTSGETLSP
jgi:hypothetical protein